MDWNLYHRHNEVSTTEDVDCIQEPESYIGLTYQSKEAPKEDVVKRVF